MTGPTVMTCIRPAAPYTPTAFYGLHGETVTEVPAAVARAKELAGADDMIFIGGSTYEIGRAHV